MCRDGQRRQGFNLAKEILTFEIGILGSEETDGSTERLDLESHCSVCGSLASEENDNPGLYLFQ